MSVDAHDLLIFVDEPPPRSSSKLFWPVLIVDDEPDVHTSTQYALKGLMIEGRELAFEHCYNATDALERLQQSPNFAVALIDVVMEHENAGLELVRAIREQPHLNALRIILRTGQPGHAPEIDTIRQYDINDYKTKSELTRIRLFTSVTMAVRAYAQLQQLEANRQGLENILAAISELGQPAGMKKFAAGVVTQLCALLQVGQECLVCAVLADPEQQPWVLAAAGQYASWVGLPLAEVPQARVRDQLSMTLASKQSLLDDGACVYFPGNQRQALAAFIDLERPISPLEQNLLQVFCHNIAIAFDNLQLHQSLTELAYHDALVNLPNRNGLMASIDGRHARQNCVALIDLDGFADINSILDDSFGDLVLQALANRLASSFSSQCCVARVGSDLFGLLGPSDEITAERIIELIAQPFVFASGEPLRLSATTGLVLLDDPKLTSVEILKNAGAALKEAKHFQRGKALQYQASLALAARDRMQLLSRLRLAFSAERLQLYYQPIVHLASGDILGAESLMRWKNDEGQFIAPDRFIPLAEQSGLMVALGEWVIHTALRWRAGLAGLVKPDFRVCINVSQVQFSQANFVELLLASISQHGLCGPQVEIELTESVAAGNIPLMRDKLSQLQAQGISIAMDDFGTGYSSLSMLQQLKLNRVKIDRSFVSGSNAEEDGFGIATTILALARHLRLYSIAEGIETQAQQQAMISMGCQEGQGYLFSPPVDESQFAQLLNPGRGNP